MENNDIIEKDNNIWKNIRAKKRLVIVIGLSVLAVAVSVFFLTRQDEIGSSVFVCGDKITYQGETYKTAQIGEQCWLAENLKATKYRDGSQITNFTTGSRWSNDKLGAYSCYDNLEENCSDYGALYNWYAVSNPLGLCPEGWSVPTNEQWLEMARITCYQLGHDNCQTEFSLEADLGWRGTDEGKHLKSKNFGGTDSFNFSAIAGGLRNAAGPFSYLSEKGLWWTSTFSGEFAYTWLLDAESRQLRQLESLKSSGLSIRCIKD